MDIKLLGICFGHQAVRLVQGIAYTARCSIPRRLNHSRPALPSNRYWKSPCRFGFSATSAEEAEEFNAKTCAPEKEIHHNRPDPAKRELHKPDLPCMCADPIQRGTYKTDPLRMDTDLVQILIKPIEGKHFCMRISKGMSILELKKEIQGLLGIPAYLQNLICSRHSLQDYQTL